jgi:DNA gyrase inhibitor GyrI
MKKLTIISGIIILSFFVFINYMGIFDKISVNEKEIGPFKIACKEYKGPYQQTEKVFNEVSKLLGSEYGLQPSRGIGFYYDDRRILLPGNFRSKIGFIIEQGDYAKLPEIAKKLEVIDYAATKCVVVEFPLRNNFSYQVGPVKVYPEIAAYCSKHDIKYTFAVEIYDMPHNKIIYALQEEKK